MTYTLSAFREKSRLFYCLEETAFKLVLIGMILYCWMFKQNNESPASLPSLRFLDRASENWSTNLRQMLPEHRTLPQFTCLLTPGEKKKWKGNFISLNVPEG
jgi:hypothetical protein